MLAKRFDRITWIVPVPVRNCADAETGSPDDSVLHAGVTNVTELPSSVLSAARLSAKPAIRIVIAVLSFIVLFSQLEFTTKMTLYILFEVPVVPEIVTFDNK